MYAQFIDGSGNVSTPASAGIVLGTPVTLSQAKAASSGSQVVVAGEVVTAVFASSIYIEDPSRDCGILVSPAPSGAAVGQTIDIAGTATVINGEKAISLLTSKVTGL